ncbi:MULTISPECIES: hypothetical protein [unclassified Pseudomonas]|uniref:hypothetical protein n=1 Tax=unclassified Pseudomonas TaxID=196821 RepID=UPI001CBEE075|nr:MULTISPECIES: hypothetical protein [unclassified Pseudomonas]
MMLKGAEDSERIAEFYEYIRDNGCKRGLRFIGWQLHLFKNGHLPGVATERGPVHCCRPEWRMVLFDHAFSEITGFSVASASNQDEAVQKGHAEGAVFRQLH